MAIRGDASVMVYFKLYVRFLLVFDYLFIFRIALLSSAAEELTS